MPLSFKLIGAGLLRTLFGFFSSLTEIRLALFGKHAKAEIVDGMALVDKDSGAAKRFDLQYRFHDETGRDYTNGFSAGPDFNVREKDVDVLYLAGNPDTNKLANKSGWKSYLVLIVGVALTGFGGWYFTQESVNQAHAETARDMRNMKNNAGGRVGRLLNNDDE